MPLSPSSSDPQAKAAKVLLILPYEPIAAFMQADVDVLSKYFDLDIVVHNSGKRRLFTGVLRRLLFNRPRVILLWFIVPSYALALTLMAKLLGVRVAFFTGGFDIVSMPRIGFGAMRFPLFRLMLKPTMRLADLVMPFSHASDRTLHKYARPRKSVMLYPGVDTDFFRPSQPEKRTPLAITVSPVNKYSIVQKGLDIFVQAARYAPDVHFVLVGTSPDGSLQGLKEGAPPNVEFIEQFLPAEELRLLFATAACYVQASLHEGFGVAVAEAMSCGAVPVVTRVFSLPEVVGDDGEYIPLRDPAATAEGVRWALAAPLTRRQALRERIVTHFTKERHEQVLVRLVRELL